MISHPVYLLVHFAGVLMIFLTLGGVLGHALAGGSKADDPWRKAAAATHGIGLLLVLVGGFGMLARLGIHWPWPGWVVVKFAIWIALGGATAVAYRAGTGARTVWWVILALGVVAASMAIFKPV